MQTPYVEQFARALYESTKDCTEDMCQEKITRAAHILTKDNRAHLLDDIIDAYKKHYDRKEHILRGVVYSARELTAQEREKIDQWLQNRYPAYTIAIEYIVQAGVIGGIRIVMNDERLDYSVNGFLQQLADTINK